MHNSYFHTLGTVELMAIGSQLDAAIDNHGQWLKDLHRALICRQPVPVANLAADAHHRCKFGQWYYGEAHEELVRHPDFIAIGEMHKEMHDRARMLGERLIAGELVESAQYDSFIDLEIDFARALTILRDRVTGHRHMVDPLVDVPGRRVMYAVLLQEQERIKRTDGSCVIALLDLDHFKSINDSHGHTAGDQVLRVVAGYLKQMLRGYDSLFRYGGEEFLLCLPDTTKEQALKTLDRLRQGVETLCIRIDGNVSLRVTISIGAAALVVEEPLDRTIDHADIALYQAKSEGRNCVRGYWHNKQGRKRLVSG